MSVYTNQLKAAKIEAEKLAREAAEMAAWRLTDEGREAAFEMSCERAYYTMVEYDAEAQAELLLEIY